MPFTPSDMADYTARRAASDIPTCPDCGSFAQGRGYFGNPYCGLCERSIPETPLVVAPNAFTTVYVSADRRSIAA